MRKVYITGLGFITSIGNDLLTVAESLRDLRHGMVQYPPFQKADVPVKVAAPIRDFQTDSTDQEDWLFPARYSIRRETLRGMAPHGIYSYCAMQQAVEDAKLTEADWSNPQTGLYAASAGSPFLLGHHLEKMRKQGVMRCPPLGIVAAIAGTVKFNLVAHFKIKGASTGFSSACASSSHAMGFAYDEIALGRQSRMFVVGAEDGNYETIAPFAGMRALSLQHRPGQASRPFDMARDGFVGTGGEWCLFWKARTRSPAGESPPIAKWPGGGRPRTVTMSPFPTPRAGLRVRHGTRAEILEAGCRAGCRLCQCARHLYADRGCFRSEGIARRARAPNSAQTAVSSTKALTGHGLSLAGAMESAFCALAIKDGFMPGSAHITRLDPACDGLNIIRATLPHRPQVVLSNSSGFGGANVALVFKSAS
jgi:3-oxoacyl-[acyl-carrier-protein] synthase-1